MDHIFTLNKSSRKISPHKENIFNSLPKSIRCSISPTNVIAFSTESDLENSKTLNWSSNVYVADLNSPWLTCKILSNSSTITVLQWDSTGELLLVADQNGYARIYREKDHLLNEWTVVAQTNLEGENIISAAFFHTGKKICINPEKKDSSIYSDKFTHLKFACSVKQFGGRPCNGVLLLTSTGMLCAMLFPPTTSQTSVIITTESLAPIRILIKAADICFGKNGHFLIAVSSGDPVLPILCYHVSVMKSGEKCIITSNNCNNLFPSFFLSEAPPETGIQNIIGSKGAAVTNVKWMMREDADSLVISAGNDTMTTLQVWELIQVSMPVHSVLGKSDTTQHHHTVRWQYHSHFQYPHRVTSLAISKLSLINNVSSGYVVVAFKDNSIHCLYRDTLKPVVNTNLMIKPKYMGEPYAKYQKISVNIVAIDMSWLGNVLVVIDSDDSMYLFKLPPQIDSSTPLSVPYCTTILEYCLVSGMDWLDLLLVLRPSMLDPLCDRLTESFNRQPSSLQQYYYMQYLCMKTSLYGLSAQGQTKANDLTHFSMLHSISTAFKSLLRPSEMSSHEKSPADSLSNVINEGQCDVDKLLMHLEAKEFTVEPTTLQSLQQLIQWVGDLAVNLLLKIPESRPSQSKGYELIRDVKALNMLREMLILIRIWGLLRPACLPCFIKSDANLDILALVFRLLSRLVQNVNEPDESLIDDCCQLSSQVMVQPMQLPPVKSALASPQLAQQILPLQLEYGCEPEYLVGKEESNCGQTVDSIRHLYLGKTPRIIKKCVRCGSSAGIVSVTRTAAIRAWDQRWLKSCQCGGIWRKQTTS
ncbi:mediator of RNA polymerase II transcription subunit 16 [Coccinella septempunctata]|uniref:mediator of RNA polymerase II transcription subunit 16 n=1 Tax=Coccinella septempunctata TaxID=41139 RepID=UPI001D07BF53|nr:mediator of RNA polymerase II transcription subunit 16 [Coccinella septempunctata]